MISLPKSTAVMLAALLSTSIAHARPPLEYSEILERDAELRNAANVQYEEDVVTPIEKLEWQAAIDAEVLLGKIYTRHQLIYEKAKYKEEAFECDWFGCPMTDSQQDAKSAMVVWSALMGRALVEHERTKVDKANNSKTPRQELARALRVLRWTESELHYARYVKQQVDRTFKTRIYNFDADAVVTGATADVAVARKAYDKQKVIAKSREVDEAALAELKRALASADAIKHERLVKLVDYHDGRGLDDVYAWFMAM